MVKCNQCALICCTFEPYFTSILDYCLPSLEAGIIQHNVAHPLSSFPSTHYSDLSSVDCYDSGVPTDWQLSRSVIDHFPSYVPYRSKQIFQAHPLEEAQKLPVIIISTKDIDFVPKVTATGSSSRHIQLRNLMFPTILFHNVQFYCFLSQQ